MRKLLLSGLPLLLLLACGEGPPPKAPEAETALNWKEAGLTPKVALNSRATEILESWPEFETLETAFDALYTVTNREDLSLVLEQLLEAQQALEDSEYPERFDTPPLKSRQRVFKTYLLKLQAALEYGLAPAEATGELITAYNAFRQQFNVTVNNTLDTNMFDQ